MRFWLLVHLILTVFLALLTYVAVGLSASTAVFVGGTLALVNIALIHFSWKRILAKKSIALSVGVIVIKYATLGFIIYRVAHDQVLMPVWFCLGISIVMLSALVAAVKTSREQSEK